MLSSTYILSTEVYHETSNNTSKLQLPSVCLKPRLFQWTLNYKSDSIFNISTWMPNKQLKLKMSKTELQIFFFELAPLRAFLISVIAKVFHLVTQIKYIGAIFDICLSLRPFNPSGNHFASKTCHHLSSLLYQYSRLLLSLDFIIICLCLFLPLILYWIQLNRALLWCCKSYPIILYLNHSDCKLHQINYINIK